MLNINNRRLKKQYVIHESGIMDSIVQFLVRTFASQAAKQMAPSAAKEIGKTALDAGKTVAVEAGKKLIEKVTKPETSTKKKLQDIMSKYTGNENAVAIEDLVKKLNGPDFKKYKTL